MGKKISVLTLVLVLIGGMSAQASGNVFAVENEAEALYGRGVHAFFSDDYQETVHLLAEVEKLGSQDPRPYFFIALAQRRLGKNEEAEKNFKKAARLEWEGRAARDYKVSEALRRIQGNERLFVEKYRTQARLEWQKTEKRRQEILFGERKARDREIMATLAKPVVGTAPFGANSVNPFGTISPVEKAVSEAAQATKETEEPATEVEPKVSTTKTDKAEDDDPFGMSEDKEAKEDKKEKTESPMTEDEEDDPFADSDDTKKAEEKKEEKKADDDEDEDDPFQ